jgi:DNA-binding NtrC family response regulator
MSTRLTQKDETARSADTSGSGQVGAAGIVVVFGVDAPRSYVLRLDAGWLALGYHSFRDLDERISGRHAEIGYDGVAWTVRDVGSLNGTYIDSKKIRDDEFRGSPRVLRLGRTLLLPVSDVGPFEGWEATSKDGGVAGPGLHRVLDDVACVAGAGINVLITGETGAGKERVAHAVHNQSRRRGRRFIPQNFAAIPAGLVESELFGYKKGAFAGADRDKEGLFQLADGGTLFLDEIGELPLELQSKLLRVLQEGEIRPLGAVETKKVDVRIVAATNRDLKAEVRAGRFREDLYYRLNAAQIRIPPLRDRMEEIPWHVAQRLARVPDGLTPHAKFVEACLLRPWPGNIRELHHAVDAAAALARSNVVRELQSWDDTPLGPQSAPAPAPPPVRPRKLTREEIVRALRAHHWKKGPTARALGMHTTQLRRDMKRLEIPNQDPECETPS